MGLGLGECKKKRWGPSFVGADCSCALLCSALLCSGCAVRCGAVLLSALMLLTAGDLLDVGDVDELDTGRLQSSVVASPAQVR